MIRRAMLMAASFATLAALLGGVKPEAVAAKPGCACCGTSCTCPACSCDASAKLGEAGCDCCGPTCCVGAAGAAEACCD